MYTFIFMYMWINKYNVQYVYIYMCVRIVYVCVYGIS